MEEEATITSSLADSVYVILRKCGGYRLEHIFNDNFYACQFFALLNSLKKEFTTIKNKLKDKPKSDLPKKHNRKRV